MNIGRAFGPGLFGAACRMSDWLDAERYVEQAHECFERGSYDEAEAKLREALSLDPYQAEWYFNLALTLEAAGRYAAAIEAAKQALELEPEDSLAHLMAGVNALRLDRLRDAVRWLERAAALDPSNIDPPLHLIEAHARLGDLDKAETQFYVCQMIDERDGRPFSTLADALLERGEVERALSCLREAASREPDLPQLHAQLARAYQRSGRLERARQLFLRELRQDPGDVETLIDLGRLLEDLGRPVEASEKYRRVLELEPGHAEAHLCLGELAMSQGDRSGALEYLELAYRLDASLSGCRRSLADALLEGGSASERRRARRLLIAEADAFDCGFPGSFRVEDGVDLGQLLLDCGAAERAVLVLERVLDDQDADSLHRLSVACFSAGDLARGSELALLSAKRDQRFVAPLHNLAVAAYREGRDERCREWIDRVLAMDPENRTMRRLRARLAVRAWVRRFEAATLWMRARRAS